MEWVRDFYSRTGTWWGPAEATVSERDLRRVGLVERFGGAGPHRILELGCGYGTTAAAAARAGHAVTGVEISDRAEFAGRFEAGPGEGTFTIVRGDFYDVSLDGRFDLVCYWNGFGVGSDADQRRLLARIADDWLAPGSVALVDIANPFVWARWDGDEETKDADPDAGYAYNLRERTAYDPVHGRGIDTWWEAETPDQTIRQSLRCYTPADLRLLLEGTGLAVDRIVVGADTVELDRPWHSHRGLLHDHHEYVAVLRPAR